MEIRVLQEGEKKLRNHTGMVTFGVSSDDTLTSLSPLGRSCSPSRSPGRGLLYSTLSASTKSAGMPHVEMWREDPAPTHSAAELIYRFVTIVPCARVTECRHYMKNGVFLSL